MEEIIKYIFGLAGILVGVLVSTVLVGIIVFVCKFIKRMYNDEL